MGKLYLFILLICSFAFAMAQKEYYSIGLAVRANHPRQLRYLHCVWETGIDGFK
jgi:hypothetical protein